MTPERILSSDSHVFDPPDLWAARIDAAIRDDPGHLSSKTAAASRAAPA